MDHCTSLKSVVNILRDVSQCQRISGSTQTSRKGHFSFARREAAMEKKTRIIKYILTQRYTIMVKNHRFSVLYLCLVITGKWILVFPIGSETSSFPLLLRFEIIFDAYGDCIFVGF